jgi:hypothetical protein
VFPINVRPVMVLSLVTEQFPADPQLTELDIVTSNVRVAE